MANENRKRFDFHTTHLKVLYPALKISVLGELKPVMNTNMYPIFN